MRAMEHSERRRVVDVPRGRKLGNKGTAGTRIASMRSPLWKGAATVHGPQRADESYSLPRKLRAVRCDRFVSRVRAGTVVVVRVVLDKPRRKSSLASLGKVRARRGRRT